MRNVQFVKKNYIYINITILALCIYVIFFVFILSDVIDSFFPEINKCVYLKATGRECPLCGGTRYFKNILYGSQDISYLFCFFGAFYCFMIFEIMFRVFNIIRKEKITKSIVIFDFIIHILALTVYLSYEVMYLLN